MPKHQLDLPKLMFSMLFLVILITSCFWIIQPFILGFAWASMVVIATWPLLLRLQKILWNSRFAAVFVMTLLLLLLFVIPIAMLINSVVDYREPLLNWAKSSSNWSIPELLWLKDLPMIGSDAYSIWHNLIADGGKTLLAKIQPYVGQTTTWFVAQAAHAGKFIIHCLLMVAFSAILYSRGEQVSKKIHHFAFRLAHNRGETAVTLAAQAIRAVALGVVVTALIQSLLGGIGVMVAGLPYTMLLTLLMFICCVAQLGPLLVLLPAVIYLYWSGDATWGTALLIWSALVAMLDTVLRPALIRRGADLPLLLILSGVIGGLLAFGMIGLFIGPVVLAVSYRLLTAWIDEAPVPDSEDSPKNSKI